jgi:hypothetical protein
VRCEIIRPILRGRDIKRYGYEFADLYLIALFPSRHYNIGDFPSVENYLANYGKDDKAYVSRYGKDCWGRKRLEQSGERGARKMTNNKWFETQDTINYWEDFSKQKIVWARLMRISKTNNEDFPRFAMVEDDYFVLDSLCFITGERLEFLLSVLNSEMGTFQYFTNIVSLDEGGMQMRQQFIEEIPVPRGNQELEAEIVRLYRTSSDKTNASFKATINRAIYELYGLDNSEIAYIREYNSARYKTINNR